MPTRFHTQAQYYLLLAQVAYTPEDKALLLSMGCAWHRLARISHTTDGLCNA